MSPRPDRRPDSRPDRGPRRPGPSYGNRSPRRSVDRGRPAPGGEAGAGRESPRQRGTWDRGGRERFGKERFGQERFGREPRGRQEPPADRPQRPGSDRFPRQRPSGDAERRRFVRRSPAPDRRTGDRRMAFQSRPPMGGQRFDGDRSTAAEASTAEADSYAGAAPGDLIWGRHSTQSALESGRPIHRIWCTAEMRFTPRFLQLLRDAKASGVLVEEVTWARLGQITGGAVHQGIVLQPAAAETLDLASLIEGCATVGESPLLIAVDGLTDPQNLGAIVRSAEALGAHGMVLPQRRNAGLTGSVAKVAAGALEHLPVARVVNLNRSLETLKEAGYRVVGLAEEGTVSLEEVDLDGPLVVVTGSEGSGLSMLTRRTCDQLVRIPLRGATPSLNASVATALLLYEVARRGWMKGLRGTAPAPRLVRPSLPTTAPEPAIEPAPPTASQQEGPEAADAAADSAALPPEDAAGPDEQPRRQASPDNSGTTSTGTAGQADPEDPMVPNPEIEIPVPLPLPAEEPTGQGDALRFEEDVHF